ncbi:MAG: serine hydrolase [Niabella sp.]
MKGFIYTVALALLFLGCKANDKKGKTNHKTPETPKIDYTIEEMSDAQKQAYHQKLSALFDSMLIKRNFNGGILVAKGGNILYEKYIGYQNPQHKTDTINEHTAFHLASTSKPFTGMAILKLVQDGKLSLNEPLTQLFPGFPYEGVTVHDLLCHRSGLPNYLYFMEDKAKWNPQQMPTNQDVLDFLIKYKPAPSFRPNTHFSYCNTNFVLLALILEKITGKPFPQYIKETIFDPLGMNDTFVYTPAHEGQVIKSYKPSNAVWENDKFENTYGDKNVYSTPEDLMKWDMALYNSQFIRQSLLDSAYMPQSHEKPSIHNYGLGWRMLNLPNGKHIIYHNGKWHGFTPAFARLIDEKAVIIILGNRYNQNIYDAAKHAYNIFGDYIEHAAQQDEASEDVGNNAAPIAVRPAKKTEARPQAKQPQPKNTVAAQKNTAKTKTTLTQNKPAAKAAHKQTGKTIETKPKTATTVKPSNTGKAAAGSNKKSTTKTTDKKPVKKSNHK